MSISKIKTGSITTDAITEAKIADSAIENEHLNTNVVIGQTELAELAANNDIFLVYDTSSGTLKKILSSNVGVQAPTFSSVSPTNVNTGDGTGNATFTITGTNFDASVTARLRTTAGVDVNFDTVTRDSATQITGVIAISSLSNANEPYDVVIVNGTGLQIIATDQININAQPVYVTASGSLGDNTVGQAGSFSVNATDPESAGNVTFELQSGSLPPGYSITNTAAEGGTAIISGTDSTTGSTTTFNFVLRAVDAASNTSSRSFSIRSKVPVSESFTSSGIFSVPSGVTSVDVLVVAGGAGAGSYSSGGWNGAGGGAGGLIFIPGYPVTPGGTVSVTVGCGGGGGSPAAPIGNPGSAGQDSVFGTLTAKGGGGGGGGGVFGPGGPYPGNLTGKPGGSGGGHGSGYTNSIGPGGTATQPTQPGQSGAYGFGNPGGSYGGATTGYGGGGGGAGAAGANTSCHPSPGNSNGGVGKAYTIADGTTPVTYAAGGDGCAPTSPRTTTPGGANTGNGGDAGQGSPGAGGSGGKGIVIVRY